MLGKGIGVVAKRLIPTMSRIIVEGIHFEPDSHPAIADLHPEGGSLGRKFQKNCLEGDEDTQGRNYIALRISRVNHSCAPNAAHNYCESSKVEILYACRDIQEGEEICFGYRLFTNVISSLPFPGMTIDTEFGSIGAVLQLKWGITCPSDCYCKDEKLKEDVVKLRSLFEKFDRLRLRCLDPTVNRSAKPYSSAALLIADDILALQEKLNASWIAKANVHSAASEIASLNPSLAKSAFDHAKKLYDIYSAVCPLSKATKTHEQKLQFASSWNI